MTDSQNNPIVDKAVKEYMKNRDLYGKFASELKTLLGELTNDLNIKPLLIEHRAKEVESFKKKINDPGRNNDEPLSQTTDLAGVRVVLHYLGDVDSVCELIEKEFEIDRENSIDKSKTLEPHEFGYNSIHYIVKLSESRAKHAEWRSFKQLKAEIQIRTILQHAWATNSHVMQYKQAERAPSKFRRQLFLLSGLLELTDQQFASLRKEQKQYTAETDKNFEEGEIGIEINMTTILGYFKTSKIVGKLEKDANKIGYSIEKGSTGEISNLVGFLSEGQSQF